MENNSNESMEVSQGGKVKAWFEDNLRVLLSILIVIAIAGGIYSYSQRSQAPTVNDVQQDTEDTTNISDEEATENTTPAATEGSSQAITTPQGEGSSEVAPVNVSKETEGSFIESANRGDGTTHLARRALANYLEKNPDSTLTPEHKIYIEDYLRKNVPQKKLVPGSSVEFSKTIIKGAIEKSKTLNDAQLNNLKKYSARVPSLR